MERTNQAMARVFKAMGDENRLTILFLLHTGERCACRLQEALAISQPTLSHHMHILLDAGLVRARKDGKWIYYTLSEEGAHAAKELLCGVLNIQE
ncbi:MAG: winged helix-turn-helix transcriptional regulator [Clostridia bacterium]|nr:winged helix-turn-helix transcriptional regulator [Clostridia bacterium]